MSQPASNVCFLSAYLLTKAEAKTAVSLLLRAEKEHPDDFWLHMDLATSLCRFEHPPRVEEALTCYRIALAKNPKSATVYSQMGGALSLQGKQEEAIACQHKAIDLQPTCDLAYCNLGGALSRLGKFDDAIAAYEKAIDLNPTFAPAFVGLANDLERKGSVDKAVSASREAIRLDPDLAIAYSNLANALCHKGGKSLEEAFESCEKALKLDPDLAEAHNCLGKLYMGQSRFRQAISEYEAAIKLRPDYGEALGNLGITYYSQNQMDKAIATINQAIAAFEKAGGPAIDLAIAHTNLGSAWSSKGDRKKSLAAFEKANQIEPDFAPGHYGRGLVLGEQGQHEKAIEAYREAIRLNRDYAEAHCNLGIELMGIEEYEEALTEVKRYDELCGSTLRSASLIRLVELAAKMDGDFPAIVRGEAKPRNNSERLGVAQRCQGRKALYATAVRFYEEAFSEDPKLLDDLGNYHRYNAACAAALACLGKGRDAAKLNETERDRLRRQALAWLRADLTGWAWVAAESPRASAQVAKTLAHWQEDADLAGVRDKSALEKLPNTERAEWEKLWADVAELLKKTK
jgi:tetratricopeptide (TPR) repeat protein